jgi:putative SOS response-associated peptidase YedK
MCNAYVNKAPYRAFVEVMERLGLPLLKPGPEAAPNLAEQDPVRPTDTAPVIRAIPGGTELAMLRWGFSPGRPKAGPVINFRSEGRRFTTGRCLIPASAFYEFTGAKYPKTRWRFTATDADWFCFAGLWRPPEGEVGESFTLLTTAPGPDVAPYHYRQPVVLDKAAWTAWLDPSIDGAELLKPSPAGALRVEEAPQQAPAGSLL